MNPIAKADRLHLESDAAAGVRTRVCGHVLEITLDRPKANAIDTRVSHALCRAFCRLRDEPALRVGIITGAGERFFSAGWDLKAAAQGESITADHGPGGFAGLTELFDLNKPVIAAVNGLAVGGGFELALACDLIVAAEQAEFFLPEVTLGIIPDSGGVLRLPRLLPRQVANELLMTGDRLDARAAQRWGLVNRVVARDQVLDAAHALAQRLAANAPLALQAVKEVARDSGSLDVQAHYRAMRAGRYPVYSAMLVSADAGEGMAAHAEGRPPAWQGA